tara:strand:+ start:465 stop:1298 length:834 start_codon:yes stop_codon:yes gene_type:complete
MKRLKFAIIGKPLSHSLSPVLHNYWFKKYNIEANYELMEIEEAQIKKTIELIKKKEIKGINVTLPYKKAVIPFLSKIINDAEQTHSVNTILLDENDNLIGENTDVFGFQAGYLQTFVNQEKNNTKALILGAGGVSPSIILALKKLKITNIYLSNRTFEKSLFLKQKFKNLNLIKWEEYPKYINGFDIIINATSLGLNKDQDFKINFKEPKKNLVYVDTIYNPQQTNMIKYFKSKNIKTFNGLDMFIYQGQKAFFLWNKINPEVDDNLIKLLESKLNK